MEALSALLCKCLKSIRESMARLSVELSATRTIREHIEDHYRLPHPTIASVLSQQANAAKGSNHIPTRRYDV